LEKIVLRSHLPIQVWLVIFPIKILPYLMLRA
jgi:hypothetical protein